MSRILGALAVVVLVAGATLFVAGYVTASDREAELLLAMLVGVPALALALFLGSLALILSRPGERHTLRWTLLALAGSLATPLALYTFWEAMPDARQVLNPSGWFFLVVGVGSFFLLLRDIGPGTSGAK